ncbi:MAG: ABC transporter substrate-binding protein, partial [Caldilineaceae bacterium]|nr:ABC transporter substrate-binding protein [Caldilineaceae bacterium]
MIKIGLLASFEGLQRRSGYEALAVMRMALDQVTQADRAVIPLAMDAGADVAEAQRAARKMLRDPAVKAVVGPYDPELIEAIRPIMAERQIPWFLPFELDPAVGMASAVAPSRWAQALLDAVATAARQQGHDRLVLAGDSAGWPPEEELAKMETPLPVALLNGAT